MTTRILLQGLIGLLLLTILVPVILFIAAGTLAWPQAWVYTFLYILAAVGGRLIVYRKNPDTLRERAGALSADNVMRGDRAIVLLIGLLGPMIMMLVAGLDFRFGMSPASSIWTWFFALALLIVGYLLAIWALVSNPFFSAVARIQDDRGQIVVDTGPYRLIRHPGYAGGLLGTFAAPLVLGSLWALLPGALIMVIYVVRTSREDRMLLSQLAGYREYASHTRFRLLPGIW